MSSLRNNGTKLVNKLTLMPYVCMAIVINAVLGRATTPRCVKDFIRDSEDNILTPTTEVLLAVMKDLEKMGYVKMAGKLNGQKTTFVRLE